MLATTPPRSVSCPGTWTISRYPSAPSADEIDNRIFGIYRVVFPLGLRFSWSLVTRRPDIFFVHIKPFKFLQRYKISRFSACHSLQKGY